MSIDVRSPEDRGRELCNVSLMHAKKQVSLALENLDFLIMSTPTSKRRNDLTTANIHLIAAKSALDPTRPLEKQ